MNEYHRWRVEEVEVAGRRYAVATKPGVFAHGHLDPATLLLAERVEIAPGEVVVQMNGSGGIFPAVAATERAAGRVLLADRNVLAVEAARRTLAANGATNGEVILGHGAASLPRDLHADVVAVRIPHEKLALLQLLHDAFATLKVGGYCYLAGATNEGVKTAARSLERLFGNARVLAHGSSHRLVAAEKRSPDPSSMDEMRSPYLRPDHFHEVDAELRGHPMRLFSRPGVFSWEHLDEATALLADVMEVRPGDSVLDLGCGSGGLGTLAGILSGSGRVCMLDADAEAVRSAVRTVAAAGVARADVRASDVAAAVLGERFDVVVTNPPFHVGKATDLAVPLQFIEDAWSVLAPGGRLYLVANRTLPYERAIQHRFGSVGTAHDGQRFKVLTAVR